MNEWKIRSSKYQDNKKKEPLFILGAPVAMQEARLAALAGPSGKPKYILQILASGNPPQEVSPASSWEEPDPLSHGQGQSAQSKQAGNKSPSTQVKHRP